MWCFEIFASIWLGYEIVRTFATVSFDALQRIFCGAVIGFISNCWIVFFLSYFFGLTPFCGFLSIAIMSIAAYLLHKYNEKNNANTSFIFYLTSFQLLTYVIFGVIYFTFMYSSQLYNYSKSKGAGYSDMPFHLNIINSFSVGCNNRRESMFKIMTAFYSNTQLAYPFIPNFHAALLMSTGMTSVRYALLIPSIFIVFSLVMGLYSLIYYFTKSHLACFIGLIIFTNLGGLGWVHVFDPKHRNDPRRDWIHDWGNHQEEYWFHPIMHILIPQRSAMWSLPLCVWSILCLSIGLENHDYKMFILAGIMTGFMPQVQVHSFVAVAQYAIGLCLITFPYKNRNKWKLYITLWAFYGIVANSIGFFQLIPYFKRTMNNKRSFINFNPIWNMNQKRNIRFAPIILWWRGLGVFAAISLVVGWPVLNKWQIILYLPSIFVFLITNVIRYQPWELDNTKLFYAAWVPVALCVVSKYIEHFITNPKTYIGKFFGTLLAGIFIFASSYSAYMSTVQSMFYPTTIYGRDDYLFGLWIAENTPQKAVFLFDGATYNPIVSIAGRQVFMGFNGWVYSHGLDTRRDRVQRTMYQNPDNVDLFMQNNISYVATCTTCQYNDFKINKALNIWKVAFKNNKFTVYRFMLLQK